MKIHNKIILGSAIFFTCLSASAQPILRVVPSMLSTTLRTDNVSGVLYTVTNNTNGVLNNINVQPYVPTSGQASFLTLQNDLCTGTNLASGASCTFYIFISGSSGGVTQPSKFTISPIICAENNAYCSSNVRSSQLEVTLARPEGDVFAYLSVGDFTYPGGSPPVFTAGSGRIVPVNTRTNQVGTSVSANFSDIHSGFTEVAVSHDGKKVFAIENGAVSSGNRGSVGVFSGGATPTLLQRITFTDVAGTGKGFGQLAISPDDNTLYVTYYDASDDSNYNGRVYIVTKTANGIYDVSDSIEIVDSNPSNKIVPFIINISPDGEKLFVVTSNASNQGGIAIIDIPTKTIVSRLVNGSANCVFGGPIYIMPSPDNTKVYIVNFYQPSSGSPISAPGLTLINHLSDGTYACSASTSIFTTSPQFLHGGAFSANARYLYAVSLDRETYPDGGGAVYAFDTFTASGSVYPIPAQTGVHDNAETNPFGIAITPDGTKMIVSQEKSVRALVWPLVNGMPSGSPTPVEIGGRQGNLGNFAG